MKTGQVLWIIVLLVAIGMVAQRFRQLPTTAWQLTPKAGVSSTVAGKGTTATSVATAPTAPSEIGSVVHREAEAVSKLTDRPDEEEEHLKDIALHLQDPDIKTLQAQALNPQLNGDERFLSVYILGESTLPSAQESLEEIATTPIPKLHEARLISEEQVLRAQAIESLRDTDRIKHIIATSNDHFLADRAQRSLLYREGKVSAPEQQDQEALKQLLDKTVQ